jgi:hypothetical protein
VGQLEILCGLIGRPYGGCGFVLVHSTWRFRLPSTSDRGIGCTKWTHGVINKMVFSFSSHSSENHFL